ncbi:heme peroxidase, partial [Aureobasidium melanogenum]
MDEQHNLPLDAGDDATSSRLFGAIKGFFESIAGSGSDPTNPVINGASVESRPLLARLLADIASQAPRLGENAALIHSLVDTRLFDGGLVDDRQYQMEKILQLAATLPVESEALGTLTGQFIKLLWETLEHPPLSYEGDNYKYRTADGSNNNIMYPHLGKAGSYYARTVAPQTLKPGVLPDPGVIFDAVFARGEKAREHPNKLSSMLFYLATIIIHDCFHTDERDYSVVKTSSYLDLAPLYGSSEEDQKKIRTFKDGLLKPDTFSENRILGFPPGVCAIVVCFNRFHNYVAMQLKEINEGGRFKIPRDENDTKGIAKLDNDLFQTARLITCGLYVNIILIDYVRTILNLNRADTTWTLDPRKNFADIFTEAGVPSGIGNQVSVEFNLVYRWHSAISVKDEKWTNELYQALFPGQDVNKVTEADLLNALRKWLSKVDPDPSKWELGGGKYKRTERGTFRDEDLINILSDATEDVACAFGPRNVPVVMKLIETLGMRQARAWNVATLNEFRKFFKLEPHKSFSDITKDEEVARALKALYQEPDYVEMYPGLVAEDAKDPLDPGSGLCPGYTVSRTILADAVALTRGDRFYTIDYTPANLTNWGWSTVQSNPAVAQGGCIYTLLMRALPLYYRGNSVYAMFPFTVPKENRKILRKLGKEQDYNFQRPSYVGMPTSIRSWKGVTKILGDQSSFSVPWGEHTSYLTHHDYMLSGDSAANSTQRREVQKAMYCPVNGLAQVQEFYEDLTTQLVVARSERLRGEWYQLDACRDVGNPSHAIFVARLFHLPLKQKGDKNPIGVEVDQLYLALSVLFAYVFLDGDTASSFKLRASAQEATDKLAELVKIVCKAVHAGSLLHLGDLFPMGKAGQLLEDYGARFLKRLFEGGKTVDDVVWAIIPTAAAAVATQAQHFTQMLDIYLSDEYHNKHWAEIQRCAWSDDPADFDKLKGYALEANRLAPAAFGLLRKANTDTVIDDNGTKVHIKAGDSVYTDFITAGLDETVFPNPREIDPSRDRSLYIHHGHGPHACLGRPMVEVAMAAQLKVFAKLKNLRRAPGPQGHLKKTVPMPNPTSSDPKPSPGSIQVYMEENWSSWWPFPTSKFGRAFTSNIAGLLGEIFANNHRASTSTGLKVHHDGLSREQPEQLAGDTGVPGIQEQIKDSDMAGPGVATNGTNGVDGDHDMENGTA